MSEKKLRFLFIIQGEGRGHMTQALSLKQKLNNAGHEICGVLVGKSQRRVIPEFFIKKIESEVYTYESPNFVADKRNKGINLLPTIYKNIRRTPEFLKNLRFMDQVIKDLKPDVIVNFYDLLAGLYNALYSPDAKFICIGHQYLLLHPDFQFPKGRILEKVLLKLNTYLTSAGADKRLALSFASLPTHSKNKISVVPPLLRSEVLSLVPTTESYFLVYLLNDGYAEEIIKWHTLHKEVKLHCFWDKKDAPEEFQIHENLVFHKINDEKFLQLMQGCAGFISTAGFESICEAIFLGKPVMMVPTKGHYEQECNAFDAQKIRAGIANKKFNLSALIDYLPNHQKGNNIFKEWVNKAEELFLQELVSV